MIVIKLSTEARTVIPLNRALVIERKNVMALMFHRFLNSYYQSHRGGRIANQ